MMHRAVALDPCLFSPALVIMGSADAGIHSDPHLLCSNLKILGLLLHDASLGSLLFLPSPGVIDLVVFRSHINTICVYRHSIVIPELRYSLD